jgi:putative alpha-1,2-mannosidase
MSLCKRLTQGGSNADIVLADAFIKGLRGDIDWKLGYEAVVEDAEVEPYDWCCNGRGGLDSWKELGYIPFQDFDFRGFGTLKRSVLRTLEYSYNHFCVAQIAEGLVVKRADVEKYHGRSNNWANLFRSDMRSLLRGTDPIFTGFPQPRYHNITLGYQDPL